MISFPATSWRRDSRRSLIAKAVICLSFFDQLLCIFHIDAGLLTLALYIRTTAAVLIRSLIMDQAGLLSRSGK